MTNSQFTANTASVFGGAIYNSASEPSFDKCSFIGNQAIADSEPTSGGAIYSVNECRYRLTNCFFKQNTATNGGAMANAKGSQPMLINCLFQANSAKEYGGALYHLEAGTTVSINCTFTGNSAGQRGGSVMLQHEPKLNMVSSISWGNSPQEVYADNPENVLISYSLINQDGFEKQPGILRADPRFDPNSPAGQLRLTCASPARDMGWNIPYQLAEGPEVDLADQPRFNGTIDMGAFEFQASSEPFTANNGSVCPGFSLDLFSLVSQPSPGGTFSYYTSRADALAGQNPLPSSLVAPNQTTSYFVRYERPIALNCPGVKEIVVTVNSAAPAQLFTSNIAICTGKSIDLLAGVTQFSPIGGVFSYYTSEENSRTGQNQIPQQVSPGNTTTYFIRYDVLGACPAVKPVVVAISPGADIQVVSSTICAGQSVNLTELVSSTVSGGSYRFFANEADAGANVRPLESSTVSLTATTTYFVSFEAAGYCRAIQPLVVTVLTSADFQTTNTTICASQSVDLAQYLSDMPPGGIYHYYSNEQDAWNEQNPLPSSVVKPTITITYFIRSELSGFCPVIKPLTVTITAPPGPVTFSAGAATPLTVVQNTPSVSLVLSGCSGGNLTWSGFGNGSGSTIPVPTSAVGIQVYSATCTVGSCTSPVTSATVIVVAAETPPTVTGNFEGFLTTVTCQEMRGWVWDRNKPNTLLVVEFFADGVSIGTTEAKNFRQDLKDAGKGNGQHGYIFPTPEAVKSGTIRSISAKVKDSNYQLKGSPISLTCPATNTVVNQPPLPPVSEPLSATVGINFSYTLSAFADPENQPLTYTLSGLPNGLQFTAATRVISGSATIAGTYLLTYSASDGQKTASLGLTLTVTEGSSTPPVVTGNFEGFLDKVECGSIRGWVWDRNKPNSPVTVQFFADGVAIGTTEANIYRADLKNAGKGNGAHAYSFPTPVGLKDNVRRLISAKVLGSSYTLKESGKPLQCAPAARLSAEPGSELQVTVLGNPVQQNTLKVEVLGAENQPLSLRLTDVQGRHIASKQIDQAGMVEAVSFSLFAQPAGVLVLQVHTPTQHQVVKVIIE